MVSWLVTFECEKVNLWYWLFLAVTLIVNSEFSLTPYYNDDGGKDHWALGSMIIMKKGVN
jgi:hypothetical protein